jgi:hypothetical protein
MADYVWWFLIVGLVVGGVLVALVSMDSSRRDEDIQGQEREAEATLIAAQLSAEGKPIDRAMVAEVLDAHREYRRLPPPDGFEPVDGDDGGDDGRADDRAASDDADEVALAGLVQARGSSAADSHSDREADEVGHGGGGSADQDLPPA